jgi:photosystem II stability/assembly factor-like uncharacterized protein
MSTGVAPCSGLSASTGWERITPPGDLGDSQAVQVDPNNPGKLYVQMHKGGNGAHFETDGLFVSEDCGATWIRVPQGRNACDPGVNINYGSISSMIIDPTNSDVMYIVSNYGYGGVFKSENAGIDWDQTVTGEAAEYVEKMWFNTLAMDPTDNEHLVAANHEGCNGPWAPNCLTETTDGGRTWSLFPAPVGWSEGNGVHIKDANTILFATYLDGVYLTRNRGADWARVDDGMAGVGTGPMAYRGSDGRYYVASFWGVKASTDWDSWENVYQGQFVNLTGTGNNMVTSAVYSFDYFIAAENSPTSWSPIMAQGGSDGDMGGIYMVSDPENHVIYSSNFGEGLWRLVVD